MPPLAKTWLRFLNALMLLGTCVLLVLHFTHLTADFPNYSPWMDWSKYTDEGWYGDAAIRHFQLGHWYVPGDFNPAIALPVWPFLEGIVFHFTGVSLVAARALTVTVFLAIVASSWLLVWRGSRHPTRSLTAAAAALLLAASPFCFVFTRLAILEPLLVLMTLLALLVAGSVKATSGSASVLETLRTNLGPMLGLALLLPLMVLTKTTALFLVPAVAWMLFASCGYELRTFLRTALPAGALGFAIWLGYFALIVRPRFLLDYRYLFSANAYTGITLTNFAGVIADTLKDGMWMGNVLYPCALAGGAFALYRWRRLTQMPLVPALILWAAGYAAFLAYHDNLQPRYYLVIAVPLTLLVPLSLESFLLPAIASGKRSALGLVLSGIVVLAIVLPDVRETLHFVRHPEYTLVEAATQVHDFIEKDRQRDPTHNPLLLSISGSDLALMTGLQSICDDFGTLELADRVKKYRPGWYAAWNEIDDDKMDAMTPIFHLERVAAFPAMDDPDRNLLILYRLDPTVVTKPLVRKRKPTPKLLQTKVGQQPSTTQLEH